MDRFWKFVTLVCDDIDGHSIYRNVQFFIWNKPDVLNVAKFKFFWGLCFWPILYILSAHVLCYCHHLDDCCFRCLHVYLRLVTR